jgi:hypothetical protein
MTFLPAPLRLRPFRRLIIAYGVNALATWLAEIALAGHTLRIEFSHVDGPSEIVHALELVLNSPTDVRLIEPVVARQKAGWQGQARGS